MIDAEKISFRGMMQDLLKSKFPSSYYFKGRNIRISNSEDGGDTGVTNENGNEYVVSIPSPSINEADSTIDYDSEELTFLASSKTELLDGSMPETSEEQTIIGGVATRDSFILFTTDNNGFDCIWELDIEEETNEYSLVLLYARNLGFSTSAPIQAVFNYENLKLQKIYWVDGVNQLRFLNIKHSIENGDSEELIDVNSNTINIIGEFDVSQPTISSVNGGGTHTAGVIQYSYNLYRINGSQTVISPLSQEIPLGKGNLGGGELNEVVGESPVIQIDTLDTEFTHIKLYAIKYTSYNEEPSVSVIADEAITTYTNYLYYDSGATIRTASLSEFLFLGGNPIVPKHIANKYNILFAANIVENQFTFDIDTRAYSHDSEGNYTVYTDIYLNSGGNVTGGTYTESTPVKIYNVPENHDAINIDYDNNKYQGNGSIEGGEGKFIKYELVASPLSAFTDGLKYFKFLKSLEVYRIGIQFYNRLGQISFPKWIADFRAPDNNLNGLYNTLKVTIKESEINDYIASLGLTGSEAPVGYRVLRAVRGINDKTIICQGALSPMMFQTTEEPRNWQRWEQDSEKQLESEKRVKIPAMFVRDFTGTTEPFLGGMTHLTDLTSGTTPQGETEIYVSKGVERRAQKAFLYTKMFQMHSPDILFSQGVSEGYGLKLRIKGLATDDYTNTWHKAIVVEDLSEAESLRVEGATTYLNGHKRGIIGPSYDSTTSMGFELINKVYSSYSQNNVVSYDIKGTPELTDRGQGITAYNGDSKLNFSNTLEGVISDREGAPGITTVNSWGSRCLTFVTDKEDDMYSLYTNTGIGDPSSILIGELVKDDTQVLLGNIYGGNSFERKKATEYVEIGKYNELSTTEELILSPGDTYAGQYKVARITKTDTEVINLRSAQVTEIVEFPNESSVNIYNRNDNSLQSWDSKYQPRYDEYHQYNRVYSTQPSIIQRVDKNFKFKSINEFDTRVMASKIKVPGEFIDSWTDFLDNEILDLEGKYGDINGLINTDNQIYAFQDTGVAKINVRPSVQTQGSDGITIELGRGSILYDYKYLSTFSGTLNKWSIVASPTGFYYYDALNRAIMIGQGEKVVNLSSVKGFKSFFATNTNYAELIVDNPILKSGVSGIFNSPEKVMYMTFITPSNTFTIAYSENDQEFVSFYDFTPSLYLQKGFSLLSTSPDVNSLYRHGHGEKGNFYGEVFPSSITLLAAPKSDQDKVFNNLMFKSECTDQYGTDLPLVTVNSLKVWNEHQNTGEIVLNVGRRGNINRKFRNWMVDIPKVGGTRQRIRNPWAFIELGMDNYDNNKLILHDIIVSYTL